MEAQQRERIFNFISKIFFLREEASPVLLTNELSGKIAYPIHSDARYRVLRFQERASERNGKVNGLVDVTAFELGQPHRFRFALPSRQPWRSHNPVFIENLKNVNSGDRFWGNHIVNITRNKQKSSKLDRPSENKNRGEANQLSILKFQISSV